MLPSASNLPLPPPPMVPPLLSLVACLLLCGCEKSKIELWQEAWQAVPEPQQKAAKKIYRIRCVNCHGRTGGGDGPGAAQLNPKPRSLKDLSWQLKITDQHIERIIVGGGAAVKKSVVMPPNRDLEQKKKVVAALRAFVRSLARPKKTR